jgi:hypothetical protein
MSRLFATLLCVWMMACDDAPATPPIDGVESGPAIALVDASAWVPLSAEQDPLPTHRPAEAHCPEGAYAEEDGALEVETGYCNYASFHQPLLSPVRRGDTLHAVLLHADLVFEEPAEAHVALVLGDRVVWQRQVAIPAEAALYDVSFSADQDLQAGSDVVFHLHNHGYNAWKLLSLELEGSTD